MEVLLQSLVKVKNSSNICNACRAIDASVGQMPSCLKQFLANQMSHTVVAKRGIFFT